MSSADEYDDPDDYLDEDESGEWQWGECDHCFGETVDGPLGPVYCACAIGQGASAENCACGPEREASA